MNNDKIKLDDFNTLLNFATKQASIKEIEKIEVEKLKPFPNHKFKLYTGERFENMVESVKEYGVLVPIIVWENDNEYIILSGHNRVEACKNVGITEVPCVIKENLTLEEATLIVTETNLMQRSFSDLSHSERAYILEQHYKVIKSQGKRNDLLKEIDNLMLESNIKTEYNIEKVGSEYNLSKNTVARYMRLAKLIPSLLEKIDNEQLAIRVGYNISFIEDDRIQERINTLLDSKIKINIEKAEKLKNAYKEDKLTIDNIENYLKDEEKLKRVRAKYSKVSKSIIDKYFGKKCKQEEVDDTIEKALDLYFRQNEVAQM